MRSSTLDDLGDKSAPKGSKPWAIACAGEARMEYRTTRNTIRIVQARLRELHETEGWRRLTDRSGSPFMSWSQFVESEWLKMRADVVDALLRERDPNKSIELLESEVVAQRAKNHKTLREQQVGKGKAGPGRGNKTDDDVSRLPHGNSADYLTARIARDHPEILKRMKAGEFRSVRAAAKEAGIIKEKTPYEQLQHWWDKASPEAQCLFRLWIDGEA